jgi:hypothetical protein
MSRLQRTNIDGLRVLFTCTLLAVNKNLSHIIMTGLAFFSQISLTTDFGLSETRKRKPVANDDFTLKQTTFFFSHLP